jgi:hypothetical protein
MHERVPAVHVTEACPATGTLSLGFNIFAFGAILH